MDLKGVIFVFLVLVNCICAALLPGQQEGVVQSYNQVPVDISLNLKKFEQALKEDIMQELNDLEEYEKALKTSLFKTQNKKRQLEIRKREPVQCLVNIVSCWRRKK